MPEKEEPPDGDFRYIHVNSAEQESHHNCETCNADHRFASNVVKTSQYTLVSFLPVFLLLQFRKKANFFFLVIAILSFTDLNGGMTPFVGVSPLVLVIGVSMAKEVVEEYRRHKLDSAINGLLVEVFIDNEWKQVPWRHVRIGHIVRIYDQEPFPADILLLFSTGPSGTCFIETSNLDGETNLKVKQSHYHFLAQAAVRDEDTFVQEVSGVLESDHPSANLEHWHGKFTTNGKEYALDIEQLLLRGCSLRNTNYVIGLVTFTGEQTKSVLNNDIQIFKRSYVEKQVDYALYFVFAMQFLCCTLCSILFHNWSSGHQSSDLWYLAGVPSNDFMEVLEVWVNFLVLFNIMVPISLYVSMEMVKFYQAWVIDCDADMYYEERDVPAHARTSNLNEELGQVTHIFSDKTGTLTQNQMTFLRCSVDTISYGPGESTEYAERHPLQPGVMEMEQPFMFDDDRLLHHLLYGNENKAQAINEFLTALVVCNAVLPQFPNCELKHLHGGEDCEGPVIYESASPDEQALVVWAAQMQYFMKHRVVNQYTLRRGTEELTIDGQDMYVNILGETVVFQIFHVIDFTSDRKRMSVLVRDPRDDQFKVYVKGADSAISPLLTSESFNTSFLTSDVHMKGYASMGLRTLSVAYKVLSLDDMFDVLTLQKQASLFMGSQEDREKLSQRAAKDVEDQFTFVGCTAIEDKLQDGVQDSIERLLDAGIKLWMLTGDKMETAINIGLSSRLLTPAMMSRGLLRIDEPEGLRRQSRDNKKHMAAQLRAHTQNSLLDAWDNVKNEPENANNIAMVISGRGMQHVFPPIEFDAHGNEIEASHEEKHEQKELQELLLRVLVKCKSVIFCRASPKQKAEMVEMIKRDVSGSITLSIGDGNNDVPMLKMAHVGVGISGFEGVQAVLASDYAIGQFRFLVPLILHHGACAYRRLSVLILYSFYKNITLAFTALWFGATSGWTAQYLSEPFAVSMYNTIFTSLPIIAASLFNVEYSKDTALKLPSLYASGPNGDHFNLLKLSWYITCGILHSLIIYCVTFVTFGDTVQSNGYPNDLGLMGSYIFTFVVLVVSAQMLLEIRPFHLFHYAVLGVSVASWWIFLLVQSSWVFLSSNRLTWGWFPRVFDQPLVWLAMLWTVVALLVPSVVYIFVMVQFFPSNIDLAREAEKGHGTLGGYLQEYRHTPHMPRPPPEQREMAIVPSVQDTVVEMERVSLHMPDAPPSVLEQELQAEVSNEPDSVDYSSLRISIASRDPSLSPQRTVSRMSAPLHLRASSQPHLCTRPITCPNKSQTMPMFPEAPISAPPPQLTRANSGFSVVRGRDLSGFVDMAHTGSTPKFFSMFKSLKSSIGQSPWFTFPRSREASKSKSKSQRRSLRGVESRIQEHFKIRSGSESASASSASEQKHDADVGESSRRHSGSRPS